MNISKTKTLIPAPEDGDNGKPAATGLFIPAIIWVTADEDGWSVGAQSFNVTPSVVVEGVSCGFEDPLTILSSPQSVTARYNSNLGIIVISVPDGTDPADYEGEVKVSMEAIVNGETYAVIKSIPVVANRKGEQGKDGVTYEILPSVSQIRADKDGNILTGVITVSAYKIKGENRTSCGVGVVTGVGVQGETLSYYWVQYRINGGSWTNCSNISVGSGIYAQLAYGVPASAVSNITSGIAFRLCFGTGSSSYSVVHEMGALQVVKDGQTGERGKTGRYYYYDGYFSDSREYTATDHQAPYIAFDWTDTVTVNGVDTSVVKTSYYMLVADTNKPGSTYIAPRTTAASGVWELMETSFKFLIAQAFFTEFGKLGSAVFSRDWMISQHGTPGRTISSSEKSVLNGIVVTRNVSLPTLAGLKNANGTYKTSDSTYTSLRNYYSDAQIETAIEHAVWAVTNNASHDHLQAMTTTSYQLFAEDDNEPFKLFTPNYAVDLLKGMVYMNDATVRGLFYPCKTVINSGNYTQFLGELNSIDASRLTGLVEIDASMDSVFEQWTQSLVIKLPFDDDYIGATVRIVNNSSYSIGVTGIICALEGLYEIKELSGTYALSKRTTPSGHSVTLRNGGELLVRGSLASYNGTRTLIWIEEYVNHGTQ